MENFDGYPKIFDVKFYLEAGNFYFNNGKPELASLFFLKGILREPLNFHLNLSCANLFYELKDYSVSLRFYRKALDLTKDSSNLNYINDKIEEIEKTFIQEQEELQKACVFVKENSDYETETLSAVLHQQYDTVLVEKADELPFDRVLEMLKNSKYILVDRCTRIAVNIARQEKEKNKKLVLRVDHNNVDYLRKIMRPQDWENVDLILVESDYLKEYMNSFLKDKNIEVIPKVYPIEHCKYQEKKELGNKIAVLNDFENGICIQIFLDSLEKLTNQNTRSL